MLCECKAFARESAFKLADRNGAWPRGFAFELNLCVEISMTFDKSVIRET